MTLATPTSIVATGDVRSHLGGHLGMLKTLAVASRRSLIVDTGDFFEGTGYYLVGQGAAERRILTDLYDVCVPGNHGFSHYLTDPNLRKISVCVNLVRDHTTLFSRARRVTVAGVDTLVTGVLGIDAFEAIPAEEREGVRWFDPARCLRALALQFAQRAESRRRKAIIILSHSGWHADLDLATACPGISVIFSGHGKSNDPACIRHGGVALARGGARAAGYAVGQPALDRWDVSTELFPSDMRGRPRESLRPLHAHIEQLTARLAEPLGALPPEYHGQVPDSAWLLTRVAAGLLRENAADQVVVNDSVLCPGRLGPVLTRGQVLECTPYGSRLVVVELDRAEALGLPARVAASVGPVTMRGKLAPAPAAAVRLATTDFVAREYLGATVTADLGLLSDRIAHVLTKKGDTASEERSCPRNRLGLS